MGDAEPRPVPDTISSWSFKRLTTYENCAYRAELEFRFRRPMPAEYDRSYAERGNAIHKGAELFVRGEGPLITELTAPLVRERIDYYHQAYKEGRAVVEQEWGFDQDWQPTGWFDSNCWQRTKCDVVVDEKVLVEVVDWKSGKKEGNEVKHAQQGLLYAIDALIKYPEAERVRIRFIYTDEGKEKVAEHSRLVTMRMLPNWDARARALTQARVFPPKPNKINCRFCPYAPRMNGGDGSCPYGVEVPRPPPKVKKVA